KMLEDLKELYPDIKIANQPASFENSLSFPYKNKWLTFPKENKSKKEVQLIHLLLQQMQASSETANGDSAWMKFLLGYSSFLPASKGSYRCLQFFFDYQDEDFDRDLWMEAAASLFTDLEDVFFLHDYEAVAIQKENDVLPLDEMKGMLHTLDDDFSARTFVYLGQFLPLTKQFPDFYQEERMIFLSERGKSADKVFKL